MPPASSRAQYVGQPPPDASTHNCEPFDSSQPNEEKFHGACAGDHIVAQSMGWGNGAPEEMMAVYESTRRSDTVGVNAVTTAVVTSPAIMYELEIQRPCLLSLSEPTPSAIRHLLSTRSNLAEPAICWTHNLRIWPVMNAVIRTATTVVPAV